MSDTTKWHGSAAADESSSSSETLSRKLLSTGTFEAMIANEAPDLRLLTERERHESLVHTLALRPPGDVWVFAYGSLIWNPTIQHVERRLARVLGWHRSFCLAAVAGRGSPENPSLVLGLDEGGHCDGVALRMAENDLEHELTILWRREMIAWAYIPRWIDLLDENGERFGAGLAFTIDRNASVYAGGLAPEAAVKRLATASGSIGTSSEYLFRTRDGLRELGIWDDSLERLATDVENALAEADDVEFSSARKTPS